MSTSKEQQMTTNNNIKRRIIYILCILFLLASIIFTIEYLYFYLTQKKIILYDLGLAIPSFLVSFTLFIAARSLRRIK